MKPTTALLFTLAAPVILALPAEQPSHSHPHPHPSWDLPHLTSLVIFGDSYSDDSRLGYFIENNGTAPPPGWVNPPNPTSADGGRVWGQYVSQYTGANLYNYAVSGAVCSNEITPRVFGEIGADFPAVREYEVPAYLADREVGGGTFLEDGSGGTVYAIWDGTNDLGSDAFLTDSQVPGKDQTDYVDCIFEQVQRLYDVGGRYFVLFNNAPLDLAPLYTDGPTYSPDDAAPDNGTRTYERMRTQVAMVNSIFDYRAPVEVLLEKRFPGIRLAVFNVHDLMADIYVNPTVYLNGTTPLNVTGYSSYCDEDGVACASTPDADSFLWYDALHPSEQTERVIAEAFVDTVRGNSVWATYWSG